MKFVVVLLLFVCAGQARCADTMLVLAHATVIDGTGAPPKMNTTIVIEGNRISAVYPDGRRSVPETARTEDLRGYFVIPGLIDAHVHLTGAEADIAHYRMLLNALVRGGVTAVRDMAGDDRLIAFLARQANTDAYTSPDIFYVALLSGPTFFAEDPRAQEASIGMPLGFAPWMQAIGANTDIPLAIAQARGTGATGVKLYANLPAAMVKALAAEAHRQGLEVWTHATIFPARPIDAVEAGADTISHSPYLVWQGAAHVPADYRMRAHGDFAHVRPDSAPILALFEAMKQHGTILDATLEVFREEAAKQPDSVGAGIMPWSYAVTELAHRHGIAVDAGTDSAGFPTSDDAPDLKALPSVHEEMQLLVKHCGFSPLEAIQAATQIGAMALGQGADRGTITRGKRADLVVLSADPSANIANTAKIAFVIKNGRRIGETRKASASGS